MPPRSSPSPTRDLSARVAVLEAHQERHYKQVAESLEEVKAVLAGIASKESVRELRLEIDKLKQKLETALDDEVASKESLTETRAELAKAKDEIKALNSFKDRAIGMVLLVGFLGGAGGVLFTLLGRAMLIAK